MNSLGTLDKIAGSLVEAEQSWSKVDVVSVLLLAWSAKTFSVCTCITNKSPMDYRFLHCLVSSTNRPYAVMTTTSSVWKRLVHTRIPADYLTWTTNEY